MRAKSFLIGTALLMVIIVAVGVISRLATGDGPDTIEVGVVSDARPTAIVGSLEESAAAVDREVSVTFFDDIATARSAVEDGDVDVAVDPQREPGPVRRRRRRPGARARPADLGPGSTCATRSPTAGLDRRPRSPTRCRSTPLEPVTLDGDDEPSGLGVLTGTLSAILLFLSLQTFGTYVLTGVVEEKSSAVVEILLVRASGRPVAGRQGDRHRDRRAHPVRRRRRRRARVAGACPASTSRARSGRRCR